MRQIISESDLKDSIAQLELNQETENRMLREQFHSCFESIRPFSIVKNTLRQLVASQEIKDNFLNVAANLATVYISKRIFESRSNHGLKKILGTGVVFGLSNLVRKNPGLLLSIGQAALKLFRNKSGRRTIEIESK